MGVALDFAADLMPPERRGNNGRTFPAMLRNAMAPLALCAVLLGTVGCGDVFRPPVSSIGPAGPAAQPTRYVLTISDPGSGLPGIFTITDFSGDSVLNITAIGVAPQYLALGLAGTQANVLNHDGSVNSFGITPGLLANQIPTSTLFAGATANSIFTSGAFIYFTEPYSGCTPPTPSCGPSVAEAVGSPPSVRQELRVPANPVYIVGTPTSTRAYALSQAANVATAIQVGSNTISNTIAAGTSPVYGVMSLDNNRAYILDRGDAAITSFVITGNVVTVQALNALATGSQVKISGLTAGSFLNGGTFTVTSASPTQFTFTATHANVASTPDAGTAQETQGEITVINADTNQLDVATAPGTNPIKLVGGAGPVWADLYQPGNLLVTANSVGNSVSIISIPLCSIEALPTNPSCDPANPTDAATFGTVLATVPVGIDPQMVTVLQDGTRAYVANTNPAGVGSVSVVSLGTFTVTKTILFDGLLNADGSQNINHGANCHPNFINSIAGVPTGKVYVTCADSNVMTVLETDTDVVRTLIDLRGKAVQMRVSAAQ